MIIPSTAPSINVSVHNIPDQLRGAAFSRCREVALAGAIDLPETLDLFTRNRDPDSLADVVESVRREYFPRVHKNLRVMPMVTWATRCYFSLAERITGGTDEISHAQYDFLQMIRDSFSVSPVDRLPYDFTPDRDDESEANPLKRAIYARKHMLKMFNNMTLTWYDPHNNGNVCGAKDRIPVWVVPQLLRAF